MGMNDDEDSESSQRNSSTEYNSDGICCCNSEQNPYDQTYVWYPKQVGVKELEYVRRMESEFTSLQRDVLTLTTQFARLQFRIRQIVQAEPFEQDALLLDLENLAFTTADEGNDEFPHIQHDSLSMGDVRRKQHFILDQLHQQIDTLAETRNSTNVPESGAESSAARRGRGANRYSAPTSDTAQSSDPDYNAYTSGVDSKYSASNKNQTQPRRESEGKSDQYRLRSSSTGRKGLVEVLIEANKQ